MLSRRSTFALLTFLAIAVLGRAADETFVPSNPPEMKPIDGAHSQARQSAVHFMHGANLGNYLEVPRGQDWGVRINPEDFDHIKAEGFDHVRVPVGWHRYTGPGPEFKLEDEIFAKVDFILTNALSRGLAVMLNIHHFDEFTTNPTNEVARFVAIWGQIATHYAQLPDTVVFELLNEPKDAATTTVLNPIYAQAIAEIRKTNPRRTIVVGPGRWNQVSELKNLILPNDDDNLIVSIHCYEPYYFTHQGATWGGPDVKTKGIKFPGPPPTPLVPDESLNLRQGVRDWLKRYNTLPSALNPSSSAAFEGTMKLARRWSEYYGRPVHVGEFGCFTGADPMSRARFYAEFRRVCAEQKLGWAIWDWNAGFRYWDPQKNEPAPGMREALFGRK
ncbi:MAG: retaining beta-glycosidase [Pedosphaera sp.]|nr:retaining beta-glycosidase [Pedosphaera sp.]